MKLSSARIIAISLLSLLLAACASGGGYSQQRPYHDGYARCQDCGRVERIEEVRGERTTSGGGAVLGGIVGGVLGNQVGGGSGRRAATVAGAVGGAVAGNAIERETNAAYSYDLFVLMDDGRRIVVNQRELGGIRTGSHVIIRGNRASLR